MFNFYDDLIGRRKCGSSTSDNMDRWQSAARKKQGQEETRTWRKSEGRREEMKKARREDAGAQKGRKVANTVFSNVLWLRGSKSRLAKAAGAEPAGQMRNEKVHAVVARSTFGSKQCQNTSCSEHFWKLRC